MSTLETIVGILIAILLVAVAAYFAWRQRATLQSLRAGPRLSIDQRRYLFKQCYRRLFGSLLLALLAALFVGSLLLDYQPLRQPLEELPAAEQEAAKQTFRFISIYWMTLLLFLMAVMALAVFDLWATARHGVQMQKQLLQEHQDMLAAELTERRHRQAEMN